MCVYHVGAETHACAKDAAQIYGEKSYKASTHLSEVVHVSAVDVVQVNDVEIRGLARRRQRRPGTPQVLRQLAGDHAL
jgi:hypothetical protein